MTLYMPQGFTQYLAQTTFACSDGEIHASQDIKLFDQQDTLKRVGDVIVNRDEIPRLRMLSINPRHTWT